METPITIEEVNKVYEMCKIDKKAKEIKTSENIYDYKLPKKLFTEFQSEFKKFELVK